MNAREHVVAARSASLWIAVIMAILTMGSAIQAEPLSNDLYAGVLKVYVNDQGLVNYKELKANRRDLDAYLALMNGVSASDYEKWAAEEKIAFWINAYNALTLKSIIDHYPIQASLLRSLQYPKNSIRQISGVWDRLTHPVQGQEMTLDYIEHEILRKQFQEPRIHFALVCASRGCPFLRNEPYDGKRLKEQLDDQVRRFLGKKQNFEIQEEKKIVSVSSLLDWYGDDFIAGNAPGEAYPGHRDGERATLAFVSRYLPDQEKAYLRRGDYHIRYVEYDWRLNEQE